MSNLLYWDLGPKVPMLFEQDEMRLRVVSRCHKQLLYYDVATGTHNCLRCTSPVEPEENVDPVAEVVHIVRDDLDVRSEEMRLHGWIRTWTKKSLGPLLVSISWD